jgi:cytochrome b6-f complex iron-sulfur subunit
MAAIVVVAVVAVAVLAIVFVASTARRRDRAAAVGVLSRETRKRDRGDAGMEEVVPAPPPPVTGREVERAAVLERTSTGTLAVPSTAAPPAPAAPVDPETYGTTRRQFLNRGVVGLMVASISGFGAACLAFLWPSLSGGFGAKVTVGSVDDVKKQWATKQPFYNPQGRVYINPYPTDPETLAKAQKVYSDALLAGMKQGYVALYQKCVHLGCRVPWCQTSQWFECPCHGSKYNRVGEKKGGPAPRGLDRFAIAIANNQVVVDTKTVYVGPPIGTDTTGQGQDGPHCVGI